jgi:hypothetical protein
MTKKARGKCCTVKPAYILTAGTGFCFVASRFFLMQILELNDPWDCESFPLKTGFIYVQFPFKIGLTVKVIFFKYVAFIEMVSGK